MATTTELVTELYIATFGRAPDASGLDYWAQNIDQNGWSIESVAQSFFDQPETQEAYPITLSTNSFIDAVYQNVLDRSADDEGKAYWATQLDSGAIAKNVFIIAILNGAKAGTSETDKALLSNKTALGEYYAVNLELNNVAIAAEIMKSITYEQTSLERSKVVLDTFKATFLTSTVFTTLTTSADTFTGTASKDWLYGLDGNDLIYTGDGESMIYGDQGDDRIYGNSKKDTLLGGEGNDTLYGGAEVDTLYGNDGSDSLHGEAGNDLIYGDAGEDYLYGEDGNDTVYGGADNDQIIGDLGDDFLYGESGNDWIDAGEGTNWVDAGSGNDTLFGGSTVDQLYGGENNDTLYGLSGNDLLDGMDGDDILYGGLGDDALIGNNGNDIIYANEGNDTLRGESGEDILYASIGTDVLIGGLGNDRFVFELGDSTTSTLDTISDFQFSTLGADKIALPNKGIEIIYAFSISTIGATTLSNALAMVTLSHDSDGTNGLVSWFMFQDNTYIYYDTTTGAYDASTDSIVKLQGILELTGIDNDSFVFV